jgi:hypothetical protein
MVLAESNFYDGSAREAFVTGTYVTKSKVGTFASSNGDFFLRLRLFRSC